MTTEEKLKEYFGPEIYIDLFPRMVNFFRIWEASKRGKIITFQLVLGWKSSSHTIAIIYDHESTTGTSPFTRDVIEFGADKDMIQTISNNREVFFDCFMDEIKKIDNGWYYYKPQFITRTMSQDVASGKLFINLKTMDDYIGNHSNSKLIISFYDHDQRFRVNVLYTGTLTNGQKFYIQPDEIEGVLKPYSNFYTAYLNEVKDMIKIRTQEFEEAKRKYEDLMIYVDSLSNETRLLLEI